MSILFRIINEDSEEDKIYKNLRRSYDGVAYDTLSGATSGALHDLVRNGFRKITHREYKSGKDLLKSVGRHALGGAAAAGIHSAVDTALYNNGVKRGAHGQIKLHSAGSIGALSGIASSGAYMAGSGIKFRPVRDTAIGAVSGGLGYLGGKAVHDSGYYKAKKERKKLINNGTIKNNS